MTDSSDTVTRWWRGISLRAKVTGVTVALLAIGLFATGIGAMAFMRNALISNLDTQLQQLSAANLASGLFDITANGSTVSFHPRADAVVTDYFVALYAPGEDGALLASTGGNSEPSPDFPTTFTLQDTVIQGDAVFTLTDSETGAQFRAVVTAQPSAGTSTLFTQLVTMPVAPVDRVVTTFLGIFGILALVTILAGALLTRWLVTLTFRGLGQVESTAMAIAGGDLSQRLTDIEPGTEVGRLKLAINTMLNRVDAALAQRAASVRQMRRFIGDASHELRTPLVSVRGYAELYRMGAIRGEADTAQAMERIEKEAIRMGVLVEDLLALARLDERRDVEIAPVDLRPIARDAALDLRAASPARTVTVIDTTLGDETPDAAPAAAHTPSASPPTGAIARAGATLSLLRRRPRPVPAPRPAPRTGAPAPPGGPPEAPAPAASADHGRIEPIVLGDENRIRQVVANLMANARRYTSDDCPIDLAVGVDSDADSAWVAVIDHGDGIPEAIRTQIFERFWRADTSRTRETGGSGLGLSIVASIVDALHGTVTVAETPGGGATFRVAFPLARARDAAEHLLIQTQPLTRLRPEDR